MLSMENQFDKLNYGKSSANNDNTNSNSISFEDEAIDCESADSTSIGKIKVNTTNTENGNN